jgi:hypothetical protein
MKKCHPSRQKLRGIRFIVLLFKSLYSNLIPAVYELNVVTPARVFAAICERFFDRLKQLTYLIDFMSTRHIINPICCSTLSSYNLIEILSQLGRSKYGKFRTLLPKIP